MLKFSPAYVAKRGFELLNMFHDSDRRWSLGHLSSLFHPEVLEYAYKDGTA